MRPYQKGLPEAIIHALAPGVRTVFAMATGGGKTWIANNVGTIALSYLDWFVWFTDRIDLAEQTQGGYFPDAGIVMNDFPENRSARVQIVMWQSSDREWLRRLMACGIGLVIIDECHAYAEGMIEFLISVPKRLNIFVLGLTATPERSAFKEGLGQYWDRLVAGPTPAELIRKGWLTPGNYKHLQGVQKHDPTHPDSLRVYMDGWLKYEGPQRSWLGFCANQKAAIKTAEYWTHAGHLALPVISGTKDRQVIYRQLADPAHPLKMVTGVGCFKRGNDIPELGGALDLAPCKSPPDHVQKQGRPARLYRPCQNCPHHVQVGHLTCWNCGHRHSTKPSHWLDFFYWLDGVGNMLELRKWWCLEDLDVYELDEPQELDSPGIQPAKFCPECDSIIPAIENPCSVCGHEFPPPELKSGAQGEWVDMDAEDKKLQTAVLQAAKNGRKPAWVKHRMKWEFFDKHRATPAEKALDKARKKRFELAVKRLRPDIRRAWSKRLREERNQKWVMWGSCIR